MNTVVNNTPPTTGTTTPTSSIPFGAAAFSMPTFFPQPEGIAKPVTMEALAAGAGVTLPPKPVDYFDPSSGRFLVQNSSGRWMPVGQGDYKRMLRARDISPYPLEGKGISEIDEVILEVQNHRDISYHGPVCGHHAGLLHTNGQRVLVTEDMRLPTPVSGLWTHLQALIHGLFSANETEEIGRDQISTFHAWMKISVAALHAGRQQQQQALAICGPPGCGKSLLQNLISDMLAGRGAKAERYFSGKTPFNSELYAAEHLILEDEHCSTRIENRLRLGASLKQHTVSTQLTSLHAKGKTAVNLPGWWRVSITLNDDPEAMMILPPLDQHIADKIILLRAGHFPFPLPMGTTTERMAARQTYLDEIPAYLHALSQWEVPDHLADPHRYNVRTYHHPELAEALECYSPQAELLELLDGCYRSQLTAGISIEATHAEIEEALRHYDPRRSDRLLSWRNACGSYLGKLSKKHPHRVSPRTDGTRRWWSIQPE